MQSLFTAALWAASVHFTIAAASSSSPYFSIQTAPATASGVCSADTTDLCESCNGAKIADASGKNYTVYCDNTLASSHDYQVMGNITLPECLLACDDLNGCLGAVTYPEGICELAIGNFAIIEEPGYTALVKSASTSASAHTTATTSTKSVQASASHSTMRGSTSSSHIYRLRDSPALMPKPPQLCLYVCLLHRRVIIPPLPAQAAVRQPRSLVRTATTHL